MKLGGFGPVDSISRFDQMKTTKAGDAQASGADLSSLSKTAASVSSAAPSQTKRAPRSSDVSKENAKDFSRILNKVEKESAPSSKEEIDSTRESLAGASGVTSQPPKMDRSPISREPANEAKIDVQAGAVASEQSTKAQAKPSAVADAGSETAVDSAAAILESLEETAQNELSMRHLSMRDFLSKMKEEFGIEPNAVVKAFASLDQQALMAPPEETAQAVLEQLNLKPEQMPKAERFYNEMLNQTGESALNETLAGVDAGISLKVLSEQDVAMEKLQKSILGLNDAFARRDAQNADAAGAVAAIPFTMMPEAAPATTTAAMATTAAKQSPLELALEEAPIEDIEDTVLSPEESELVASGAAVDTSEVNKADKKSESKFASLGAALSAATAGLASVTGQSTSGSSSGDSKSSKGDTSKPREFSSIESALASTGFNIPPMGEKAAIPLTAATSTTAAMASAMAGGSEANATNAQDLVRNAQLLVKNGGGEMKMQLKPEGAGEVTLKVAVKDGQVAIQMMTENDSTKKMLESNLDDLKTSLAQHKLHVDALKIEVGGEMAKQRFEQAQQDASREQARQMAQDFMGQFRQDREGFRQGFFESSGFKNYQQGRRNPTPELEPVAASSVSNGNKSSGGERRLNLVA